MTVDRTAGFEIEADGKTRWQKRRDIVEARHMPGDGRKLRKSVVQEVSSGDVVSYDRCLVLVIQLRCLSC